MESQRRIREREGQPRREVIIFGVLSYYFYVDWYRLMNLLFIGVNLFVYNILVQEPTPNARARLNVRGEKVIFHTLLDTIHTGLKHGTSFNTEPNAEDRGVS